MHEMPSCKDLIAECVQRGVKPPSGLRKEELVEFRDSLLWALQEGLSTEVSSEVKLTGKEFQERLVPKYRDEKIGDWYEHLIEYGWTTVPVPDLDTEAMVSAFYETLENARYKGSGERTGFRRDNPGSWTDLPPNLHGIFKTNFGHFPWQWHIREKCIPIFEQICQTSDLVCSFDGACFIAPGKRMGGSWFHCDQGRFSRESVSVQGVVALTPTGPEDGGLVVIEKSHTIFGDYLDAHPLFGFSWAHVDVNDPLVIDKPFVKVCAPAGHIMLFDSRTFHCNMPPRSQQPRMVTYVSMLPRSGATKEILQKRQKAFLELRMTGHWTYGPWMSINPKEPRSWGKDYLVPQEEIPILNERQKTLI
jgi:hypothetical protein